MAPHSSTLAWEIPCTEEPGRLQSMGSLRVGHDWRLHFHFSLSCIGEGNGKPLQCSCLENPRDEGAWWAAVYGVAQSRTRLKWLSSSTKVPGRDKTHPPLPQVVTQARGGGALEFVQPGVRWGKWAGQHPLAWTSFFPLSGRSSDFPDSVAWLLSTFSSPVICTGRWSSWEGTRNDEFADPGYGRRRGTDGN